MLTVASVGGYRIRAPLRRASKPKRPRGNKYRLCECGSYKPWANCCGKR